MNNKQLSTWDIIYNLQQLGRAYEIDSFEKDEKQYFNVKLCNCGFKKEYSDGVYDQIEAIDKNIDGCLQQIWKFVTDDKKVLFTFESDTYQYIETYYEWNGQCFQQILNFDKKGN